MAFVVRTLGLLLFAASFIMLVADGVTSLAADKLQVTSLGQTWFTVNGGSLNLAQAVVQRYVHPYLWDPVIVTVLLWPTFAVGAVIGLLLMIAGRKRKPVLSDL